MHKFTTNYARISNPEELKVIRRELTTVETLKVVNQEGSAIMQKEFQGTFAPVENSVVITKQDVIKLAAHIIDLVDKAMISGLYLEGSDMERAGIIRQIFSSDLSGLVFNK